VQLVEMIALLLLCAMSCGLWWALAWLALLVWARL
jgi:hypothetical protein